MAVTRQARVHLDGTLAGVLEEREDRSTSFSYDPTWLDDPLAYPVSLTLPLRHEPYEHRGLHPFFEGLLPEGWLLDIATQGLQLSKDDAFGLLLALGADTIGAVEVLATHPGQEPSP
jgi:serine/threonine-protein kinase HipA